MSPERREVFGWHFHGSFGQPSPNATLDDRARDLRMLGQPLGLILARARSAPTSVARQNHVSARCGPLYQAFSSSSVDALCRRF